MTICVPPAARVEVVSKMLNAPNIVKSLCLCDAIGNDPCPVHARENSLQDELLKILEDKKRMRSELGDLLSAEGCSCECEHAYNEHEDCRRCFACRVHDVLLKFL